MSKNEIKDSSLMNLAEDIKLLVNEGVYSIYPVIHGLDDASFILVTDNKKTFLLSEDGAFLGESSNVTPGNVGNPITFPNLKMKRTFRINAV